MHGNMVSPTKTVETTFIAVNFRCVDIESRPYLRIYVSNNGAPLPPGMNPIRVFEWGKGSGTGIGGAQIKIYR